MKVRPFVLALAVGGCGLVNSKTLSYEYAFSPQQFMEKLGDEKAAATVPTMACDPAASPDPCAALQAQLPASAATLQCDAATSSCIAVADVRLPYPIDLSQQSLPGPVVQYGVDNVTIEKVAYWVMTNTVNVAIPPIDLYVAPAAAKDEHDARAVQIGSVAMLPARSNVCADAADPKRDEAANGAAVCDLKLTPQGDLALAAFVKDYKTPFQFIAHTRLVAHGGEPLPVGSIDFFMRPTVSFSILK
jgi:hypothetical protein